MYHYESLGEGLPVSILRIVVHIYIAISVYMHAHAVNQFSECIYILHIGNNMYTCFKIEASTYIANNSMHVLIHSLIYLEI